MIRALRRLLPFLSLWSCTGLISDLDAGPEAPVTIHGRALVSLCDGAPGVTVSLASGSGEEVVTGADGEFSLQVPARAALLVTGDGGVPTLSLEQSFTEGQVGVEVARVPTEVSWLVHQFAASALGPAAGTVALMVHGPSPLPVGGAEVTLLEEDGSVASANERRRALVAEGTTLSVSPSATTANTGTMLIFGVRPGVYRARVTREGLDPSEVVVPVRAGTVTVGIVRTGGSAGEVAPTLRGLIDGFPANGGNRVPFVDAGVTVWFEDGTSRTGRTDATGRYAIDLPRIRAFFDVTAEVAGRVPLRTQLQCAGHWASWDLSPGDAAAMASHLGYALGSRPKTADAGALMVFVSTGARGLEGATVWLSPDSGVPFYGEDRTTPASCARSACGPGGACPPDHRCQGGECIEGLAGPQCDDCSGGCPPGFVSANLARLDGGPGCYCMPRVQQCDLSAPACGPNAYCWSSGVTAVCTPYRTLHGGTAVRADSSPIEAFFPDVVAGTYSVHAAKGSSAATPGRVRISPGVESGALLQVP